MTKLLAHFERMQGLLIGYLKPDPYVDRNGREWDQGLQSEAAFKADMIYNLDGPEQREAQREAEFDYVAEASLTLSGEFHGELVGRDMFDIHLVAAITALSELDKIKKTLFYGRDNGLKGPLGRENCYSLLQPISRPELCNGGGVCSTEDAKNLIHGIIGLATEAGELLELLYDTLEGKPLDRFNLKEEVGDGKWYMAILAKVGRFMWGDDERVNIEKLRARFPNRFTEYDANNRNLSVERDILEGDADKQLDLPELAANRFEASGGGMLSGADTN